MPGVLDGLRVIDASGGVAGGYCTKLLAGLGADVVKVEPPARGDSLRRAGPFLDDIPHPEASALHLHLAMGKRSVTLDVASRSGAALLLRLLERTDVFVAGPALMRPPLDEPPLRERFSHLVFTTISAPTADLLAHAAGGYLLLTGDPDREPVKPYGHQALYQAGLHAALGTLVALAVRERHGVPGQRVDVSAQEASALFLDGVVQNWHFFGREAKRAGARPVGFGPHRLYPSTIRPCKDGWVHAHVNNRFPELLAALTSEPRLAEPDLLAEMLGHADEIDAILDRWLASRDKWTAVEQAQAMRTPFTEVLDPGEVVEDRLGQHRARGFFIEMDHPVAGAVVQPGAPFRLPAAPWRARRAPLLGEHNVEIYCGELGLSRRSLAVLAAAAAV